MACFNQLIKVPGLKGLLTVNKVWSFSQVRAFDFCFLFLKGQNDKGQRGSDC